MRPTAPLIETSLPPSSSSPLPMPPNVGSISSELPPQPISVSPGHNHGGGDSAQVGGGAGGPDPAGGGGGGAPPTDYQQLPPPDGHSFVIQKIKESMQEEAKRFNEEKHIPIEEEKPREYY